MVKINLKEVNDLLITKYKAKIITKQQFKDGVYGFNREDIDNDISTLSEGIITNENALFYLINNVEVINKHCKCINTHTCPSDEVIPAPLSGFMPYILFVAELSNDKQYVVNYAKWGSFSDTLFDELHALDLDSENEQTK